MWPFDIWQSGDVAEFPNLYGLFGAEVAVFEAATTREPGILRSF
jgi:hypothetical protein